MGTKQVMSDWTKPEKIALIQGWKRHGVSNVEIAKNIGIGESTLYDWTKRDAKFADAFRLGREESCMMVEGRLFQKAMKGDNVAMIYYLKAHWRDFYYEEAPREAVVEDRANQVLGALLAKLDLELDDKPSVDK